MAVFFGFSSGLCFFRLYHKGLIYVPNSQSLQGLCLGLSSINILDRILVSLYWRIEASFTSHVQMFWDFGWGIKVYF